MTKKLSISEFVNNYPTKNKEGFTGSEIKSFTEEAGIDNDKFFDALGVNTVMQIDGEFVIYYCDIETALRCVIENRDKHIWEWD